MGWDRAPTNGVAHRVPERDLIAGLQVAFENEELEIAAGLTEMDALMGARVEAPSGGRAALAWWQVARRTVGVHRGGETGRAAPGG
jgi:hypothetical protein